MALFALTVFCTLAAGALGENFSWLKQPSSILSSPIRFLADGIPFSFSLLMILLFHEFGHYIAGRVHGVNVSLPYFIPAPPVLSPIGTLGAVIVSRSPFLNRRQLIDVGAAGPLAGLIIAIIVLFIGIAGSSVQPLPASGDFAYMGESLLFKGITYLVKGPLSPETSLELSSVAFAGWVGVLVTMFNLLPFGQLDGGRITYALFGRWQRVISRIMLFGLILLSFYWPGWILWIIIGFLVKMNHPPTIMDEIPIGRGRKLVGAFSILAFIVCFIPIPISM